MNKKTLLRAALALALVWFPPETVFALPSADKAAVKEAKKLEKKGWKAMSGRLDEQLSLSHEMQFVTKEDGTPRYVLQTAISQGKTLQEARTASENTARMMLSSTVESTLRAEISAVTATSEVSVHQQASSRSDAVFDASLCMTVMCLYRKEADHYEVQTTMAYDMQR